MVARYVFDLERSVSAPRLAKYRPQNGTDIQMVVNYFWNIGLSEALYPGFAALEVSLRSGIHDALSTREGSDMWFRHLLELGQLKGYADVHLRLSRELKGLQPTSGQIVAQLTFGFWTTLLSQPYNQSIWAANRNAMMKAVFPHLPPTPNNRHFVHQRYNNLRLLRNRVMHHEPIWHRANLHEEWKSMIEAIGWISPTIRESILLIDHFDDTFHNGKAHIESGLRARFNF